MIDLSELVFDKEEILSDIGEIEVEEEERRSGQATIGESESDYMKRLMKGDNLKSLKYLYTV